MPGCNRKHAARGWCKIHYYRWRRTGDPLTVRPPGFPTQERQPCKFPGCAKPSKRGARGWCGAHYMRWYRHGDPSIDRTHAQRPVTPLFERLSARLAPNGSCLEWQGPVLPRGYGYISERNQKHYVHRLAYEKHHGPVPAEYDVHHTCENKRCCNPDHLEAVTRKEHAARHRRKAAA